MPSPTITLSLTEKDVATLRDALEMIGALVPDDHTWTPEERRCWEKADAILRRRSKAK